MDTPALPIPPDESERLAALQEFAILDTAPDDNYDRLVQLATVLCGTSVGALSFIDRDRQWLKSSIGLPCHDTPRDASFCAHTILDANRLLEIPDVAASGFANLHARAHGPDGPLIGFYAGAPVKTREGSAIGALCVMDSAPRTMTQAQRDALLKLAQAISTQLVLQRQLRVATQTDRLTGLPNWFHFEAQFGSSSASSGILAFVRLKTVSQINSAHGFRVADALIKETADRLRGFVGARAVIGRIKRGLFILYFPQMALEEFTHKTAPALTDLLHRHYVVNDLMLVCPVNLGYAAFPGDGETLDEVVNAADAALQMAIERDEPMAFFDKTVDNVLSVHYRLEPQLRHALAQDQFVNYYQPKIDLASGAIVGVEALIRWIHPERGLIAPMEFVPALESTGLIGSVGAHILRRSVDDWARWKAAGLPTPRIAVNVAAAQLRNDDFVNQLRGALAAVGGDSNALGIEVTESVLIGNMDRAIRVLTEVRALGIPVAIDDFGTGYSSLAYIVTLPIDDVKIDRAFIKKITADPAYEGIVSTCISLAHNLNLKVVAEGVEIEAQALLLKKLGCDQAQGFFYSPPVPAQEMARLLAAQ